MNVEVNKRKTLSLKEASELTGYHQDYLGQLCRSGKLRATKLGKSWVTTESALNEFVGMQNYQNFLSEESTKAIPAKPVSNTKVTEAKKQTVPIIPLGQKVSVIGLSPKSKAKNFFKKAVMAVLFGALIVGVAVQLQDPEKEQLAVSSEIQTGRVLGESTELSLWEIISEFFFGVSRTESPVYTVFVPTPAPAPVIAQAPPVVVVEPAPQQAPVVINRYIATRATVDNLEESITKVIFQLMDAGQLPLIQGEQGPIGPEGPRGKGAPYSVTNIDFPTQYDELIIAALSGDDANFSDDVIVGDDLTVNGTITAAGISGTIDPSFTLGSIPFQGVAGLDQDNANLFFDNTANALGVGTNTITASAILQLDSTNKGFLPPRLTTLEKDAIASPAEGLTLFDSDLNKLNVYNGTEWKNVGSAEIGGEITGGTAGSILFVGTGPVLAQDNTSFFWDDASNRLGILDNTPSYALDVAGDGRFTGSLAVGSASVDSDYGISITKSGASAVGYRGVSSAVTSTSNADAIGGVFSGTVTGGTGAGAVIVGGISANSTNNSGSSILASFGIDLLASNGGTVSLLEGGALQALNTGTVTSEMYGTYNRVVNIGAGATVPAASSVYAALLNSAGTITTFKAVNVPDITNTGTLTNTYGVYVGDITAGTQTNTPFSFYASDASALNYFAGSTGIGAPTISAKLHVLSTTEQLRLGYDASNYVPLTVSSSGDLTVAPSGSDFNLTGDLNIADNGQTNALSISRTLTSAAAYPNWGLKYSSLVLNPSSNVSISQTALNTNLMSTQAGNDNDISAVYGNYDEFLHNGTGNISQYYSDYDYIENINSGTFDYIGGNYTGIFAGSGYIDGSYIDVETPFSSGTTAGRVRGQAIYVGNFNNAAGFDTTYGSWIAVDRQAGVAGGTYNTYGQYITVAGGATGTTTAYGLYIAEVNLADTLYAIYSADDVDSYFAGNIGIGDATPSAKLEVGNSTDSLQISSVGDITFVDANDGASITGPAGGALTIASGAAQDIVLNSADTIELQDATNVTGVVTVSSILQVGSATATTYSRLGTGTTGHSLDAANDLLISDDFEVDGDTYLDGTLTVAGAQAFSGALSVITTTSPQLTVGYDSSNKFTVAVSSTGAVTFDAQGASAGFIFNDTVSSPGAGASSERFGSGATATGDYGVAIGNSASAANQGSIALGYGATTTAASQLIVGGSQSITSAYFGNGVTAASPAGFTLNATGGSGTNIAGADLTLAAGKATGNAASGDILFQTSVVGSTGSTLQTLATRMAITETGAIGIGTSTPQAVLDVTVGTGTTTTTSDINSIGTGTGTITVASTTGWPTSGTLFVDNEAMNYTIATSTTLTITARGRLGSSAASHANASTVSYAEMLVSKSATTSPRLAVNSAGNFTFGTISPTLATRDYTLRILPKTDGGIWIADNLGSGQSGPGGLISVVNSTGTTKAAISATQSQPGSNFNTTGNGWAGFFGTLASNGLSVGGVIAYNLVQSGNTAASVYGFRTSPDFQATTTTTNFYGFTTGGRMLGSATTTVTNMYDYATETLSGQSSNTIGTRYGLYLGHTNAGTTNAYGVYQASSTLQNTFAGVVGIGSDITPDASLEVVNDGSGDSFLVADSADGDTTPFVIQADGDVGIGTTAPSRKLEVQADSSGSTFLTYTPAMRLTNSSITDQAIFGIEFYGNSTSTVPSQRAIIATNQYWNNAYNAGDLIFGVTSANNVISEAMRIQDGGNIGIGDTTPDAQLEIVNGGSGDSFLVADGSDGDTSPFVIQSDGDVGIGTLSPGAKLQVNPDASGIGQIIKANATTPGNLSEWQDSSGTPYLWVDSTFGINFRQGGGSPGTIFAPTGGPNYLDFDNFGAVRILDGDLRLTDAAASLYAGSSIRDYSSALKLNLATNQLYGDWNVAGVFAVNDLTPDASLEVVNDGSGDSFLVADSADGDTTPFVIQSDGDVGIGTTNPAYQFEVSEDRSANYVAQFFNDGDNQDRYGIQIQGGADDASGTTYYVNALDGNGDQVGYIANTSGTFALTDISDSRTKTNIQDTGVAGLETIMQLRVVDFNRKADSDGPLITGFIAQEVQEVYPNIVTEGKNGYLGITKENLIPVLVKAMQEQQQELQSVKNLAASLQGDADGTLDVAELSVDGHVAFNEDTVGQAKILANATKVRISFTKVYEYQPIATVTPIDFVTSPYRVTDIDVTGFTIELQEEQEEDVTFNWHSFGAKNGKLTVSDGITEELTIVVPAIQPNAMPKIVEGDGAVVDDNLSPVSIRSGEAPDNLLPVEQSEQVSGEPALGEESAPDQTLNQPTTNIQQMENPQTSDASGPGSAG